MNGPVNDSNVSLKAQLEASTGCVPGVAPLGWPPGSVVGRCLS